MVKIILIIAVLTIIAALLIRRNTYVCSGGRIMQGCGKILYPWSKRIKVPYGKGYCCMECLKRDIDLVTEASKEGEYMLVKVEVVNKNEVATKINEMLKEGWSLKDTIPQGNTIKLTFTENKNSGRTLLND